MAATTVKIAYISASANRYSQAADSSASSVIAFGSSTLIAIWNANSEGDPGVSETLPGHDGTVTCICFISDTMFASADDKGTLICWRKRGSQAAISRMLPVKLSNKNGILVDIYFKLSGSSDSSIKIWELQSAGESDVLIETQIVFLHGKFPLAVSLAYLPGSNAVILAIGGTDRNVQIWVRSESLFVHAATLSGHEDWVKGLAFLDPAPGEQTLALASGSQDATIRLWSIEPRQRDSSARNGPADVLSDDLLDTFEASLGDLGESEEGGRQVSLKRHILTVKSNQGSSQQYSITFDALLIGHEAGVTSVSWSPALTESKPTLLSTSTDSSVILWSPSDAGTSLQDKSSSIWINRQRFGDVGGQRLGGFVGGVWAQKGKQALAWGWGGGWRRWSYTSSQHTKEELWTEMGAISGHSGPVKGLDWSPNGNYLISVGLDQTTRLHGATLSPAMDPVWHELGRPQVHGYDLLDVVFIDPLRFVSVADEKVARVFEAPSNFVKLFEGLGISKFAEEEYARPLGASVPPLGLSNKALGEVATSQDGVLDGTTHRRPFEGELASVTLWPETEKIFGHGYESITLAVSSSKRFLATACKATTAEHAVVRVYNTKNYQLVGQPLEGHSLTVTRIAFSPDDHFVLSVSRDRSWRLFEYQDSDPGVFVPIAADRSHGRIVWDCAWAAEGYTFATASRDKTVKIWSRGDSSNWTTSAIIKTNVAATAVDFSPVNTFARQQLAVGLESGEILIYSKSGVSTESWRLDVTVTSRIAHVNQVCRLAWQDGPSPGQRMLASCSEDGTMRVLIVQSAME